MSTRECCIRRLRCALMSLTVPEPSPRAWAPPFGFGVGGERIIRWGFGDAIWTVVGGMIGSLVVGEITLVVRHPVLASGARPKADAIDIAIIAIAQFGFMALMIWLLVHRRGLGVRNDLGLRWAWKEIPWLFVGALVPFVLGVMQLPITKLWDNGNHGKQQIGNDLKDSSGWSRILLILVVVLVAPVIEETIFRGIVLRAALRRMHAAPAVLVSGSSFAALHLSDITTFPSFPALMILGMFSAAVAVRSGNLNRSILIHIGFNLVGMLSLLS